MFDLFEKFKDQLKPSAPPVTGPVEYIVAGLGNPGREYEQTRHNAGFLAIDRMAQALNVDIKKLRFQSLTGEAMIGGKRVLLLKPSTYMNKSGEAVRDALQFYKLPIQNLIVISDDISLDVGRMRIRRSGSDGGQKGLQNIIYLTGSDAFPRVRIGIGKKAHPDMALADWVLSRFTEEDCKKLNAPLDSALPAVELIIQGDIAEAMNRYNRLAPDSEADV